MNLTHLRHGDFGRINEVSGSGRIRSRLLDMGLVSGTVIQMIRRAPLMGPFVIKVRGALLSLRPSEAMLIDVIPMRKGRFRHHRGRFNRHKGRK